MIWWVISLTIISVLLLVITSTLKTKNGISFKKEKDLSKIYKDIGEDD